MDALGHVNQAVYHELLEELRSALFRRALPDLPFTGYVLAHVELDYRREVRIERPGPHRRVPAPPGSGARASSSTTGCCCATATVAVEGRAVLVAWDEDAPVAPDLTDAERDALQPLRHSERGDDGQT